MSLNKILLSSILYFLTLVIFFILLRQIQPSEIIFYQGLILLFISTVLVLTIIFALYKVRFIDHVLFNCGVLIVIIASLLFYCFHITVPSLLDRSISLYIIGISQKKSNSTINDYRDQFYKGFIVKNKAIEKRLNEQIITGNVQCINDLCNLTEKGHEVYKLNNFLVILFNLDNKYVNPVIYLNE